jgi:cell division protein FtsQ
MKPVSADVQGLEYDFVRPGETGHIGFVPATPPGSASRRRRPRRRPVARRILPRRWRTRRALPLAIALVSAIAFWAATDGGSLTRRPAPVIAHIDQLLARVGLGLSEITVTGQQMVSDRAIYDRLALSGTQSIWTVDTEAARRRLEMLPWIRKASLKRVFPDRLLVEITEHKPIAVWRDGARAFAVGANGSVLGEIEAARFARLPVIFGANAAEGAATIIDTVRRLPELNARVAIFQRVAQRRWTLLLKTGRRILLPAEGQAHALLTLLKGPEGGRLIDLDYELLDLRIPGAPAIEMRGATRR